MHSLPSPLPPPSPVQSQGPADSARDTARSISALDLRFFSFAVSRASRIPGRGIRRRRRRARRFRLLSRRPASPRLSGRSSAPPRPGCVAGCPILRREGEGPSAPERGRSSGEGEGGGRRRPIGGETLGRRRGGSEGRKCRAGLGVLRPSRPQVRIHDTAIVQRDLSNNASVPGPRPSRPQEPFSKTGLIIIVKDCERNCHVYQEMHREVFGERHIDHGASCPRTAGRRGRGGRGGGQVAAPSPFR